MARKSFPPADDPPSPCIKVCKLDPVSRLCTGCLRTIEEIGAWGFMDGDEKRAVLAALPGRSAPGRSRTRRR
ncbi:DUF1289 domain-containing protein [Zavarzinia compransoris]|uniref:DUF1289 domain-containing protein n=1 Tax=Zavarzinia compransoris TaxID=1264899 RepID=A0A317EEM9_9PROT|nr:DUF1289 domain-containing protein [Zavarzinia compransoris]PWR23625.1 DUF1289 domain-containing protein [Zavarzinia compransoris]TDP47844.1 hypothetical protein DES42_102140 [Zavarzinia compransoris]